MHVLVIMNWYNTPHVKWPLKSQLYQQHDNTQCWWNTKQGSYSRNNLKLTTRPCISVLTFWTVVAGWLDASLSRVDKKFLHLRTLSNISLLAVELGGRLPAAVDAAKPTMFMWITADTYYTWVISRGWFKPDFSALAVTETTMAYRHRNWASSFGQSPNRSYRCLGHLSLL